MPAGAPQKFGIGSYPTPAELVAGTLGPMHGGYADIDPCPSLDYLVANAENAQVAEYLAWAVACRPSEELFNVKDDPACLNNLAADDAHEEKRKQLSTRLMTYLTETRDPRVIDLDGGNIFETYPRYSKLRWFPEPLWAKQNPGRVPEISWLEARRPKP